MGRMTDAEVILELQAMARDPALKATQRLRAIEQLPYWRAEGVAPEPLPDQAPDPFEFLDDIEAARRKRARR